MISFKIPESLDRHAPHTWIASWFGCGFINPAPGTWGSLGALPFGVLIYMLGGPYALMVAAFFVTILGVWAADRFDREMDEHDSKMIVIDEVAGLWIALIPAALNPTLIIVAFIAFRGFDIIKPWPVSFFDQKVKGAIGVMGDDVVAGLFAAMCVIMVEAFI